MTDSQKGKSSEGCLAISITLLGSIGIWLLLTALNTLDNTQRGFFLYPGLLLTGLALVGVIPLVLAIRRSRSVSAETTEQNETIPKPPTDSTGRPLRVVVGCAGTIAILLATAFVLIGLLQVNGGFFLAGVALIGAVAAIVVLWRWQFRADDSPNKDAGLNSKNN